jgi:hypothetical protein
MTQMSARSAVFVVCMYPDITATGSRLNAGLVEVDGERPFETKHLFANKPPTRSSPAKWRASQT